MNIPVSISSEDHVVVIGHVMMWLLMLWLCRDAVIASVINCATSIFGGVVVFSVLGFMSVKTDIPVAQVVTDGPNTRRCLTSVTTLRPIHTERVYVRRRASTDVDGRRRASTPI